MNYLLIHSHWTFPDCDGTCDVYGQLQPIWTFPPVQLFTTLATFFYFYCLYILVLNILKAVIKPSKWSLNDLLRTKKQNCFCLKLWRFFSFQIRLRNRYFLPLCVLNFYPFQLHEWIKEHPAKCLTIKLHYISLPFYACALIGLYNM